MLYKKGDTLQIKQGSCIVLEDNITAYDFFNEMNRNPDDEGGYEHPIYSISADVDMFLGSYIWDNENGRKKNLTPQILYKVLYGDTKVAILDSEVYNKIILY